MTDRTQHEVKRVVRQKLNAKEAGRENCHGRQKGHDHYGLRARCQRNGHDQHGPKYRRQRELERTSFRHALDSSMFEGDRAYTAESFDLASGSARLAGGIV